MLSMPKTTHEINCHHRVGVGLRQTNNVSAARRVMLLVVSNPPDIPGDKVFG